MVDAYRIRKNVRADAIQLPICGRAGLGIRSVRGRRGGRSRTQASATDVIPRPSRKRIIAGILNPNVKRPFRSPLPMSSNPSRPNVHINSGICDVTTNSLSPPNRQHAGHQQQAVHDGQGGRQCRAEDVKTHRSTKSVGWWKEIMVNWCDSQQRRPSDPTI